VVHIPGPEEPMITDLGLDRPIAERKSRRVIRMPARFRDEIPEPPIPLTFPDVTPSAVANPDSPILPPPSCPSAVEGQRLSLLPERASSHALESDRNVFGLFRKYRSATFPSHDPEEEVMLADLQDDAENTDVSDNVMGLDTSPPVAPRFGPYPNESSFLLGEWFWDDGTQKSKGGFKKLVDIVSSPNFRPADIRDTNWDLVDRELGDSQNLEDWVDEFDATWIRSSVEIQVPFHSRSLVPGPRTYILHNFFHRSIVSIIKEKLTDVQEFRHFHLEPFELHWQPGQSTKPTRVYGELYTSPEFLEAHHQLQGSPQEPSCSLPRHVVALMFASDVAHLTTFGEAKVWPLYMYFGNDSKYRRSKPSLHLCHHVAYFHKVCSRKVNLGRDLDLPSPIAS